MKMIEAIKLALDENMKPDEHSFWICDLERWVYRHKRMTGESIARTLRKMNMDYVNGKMYRPMVITSLSQDSEGKSILGRRTILRSINIEG